MADTVEEILNPKAQGYLNRQADIEKEQAAANSTVTDISPEFNQFQFYDDFIKSQNGYKPEDEQERKAREKRERTNKIIAGVGDMISAIANMYYTTKGAPNSYDPKEGMTPKMQARYDMLQKEREARDKEYYSGLQRARQLDWQRNLSWRQLQEQRKDREENRKLREQQAADKKARDEALYQLQVDKFLNQQKQEQIKNDQNQQKIDNQKNKGTGKTGTVRTVRNPDGSVKQITETRPGQYQETLGNTPPSRKRK